MSKNIDLLNYIDVQELYIDVLNDIRVLPSSLFVSNHVNKMFSSRFKEHVKLIYNNSPFFFNKLYTNTRMFEMYQKYYYLLCMITMVNILHSDTSFMSEQEIGELMQYSQWTLLRKSELIDYLMKGPVANEKYDIDFVEYYKLLIAPYKSHDGQTQTLIASINIGLDGLSKWIARHYFVK